MDVGYIDYTVSRFAADLFAKSAVVRNAARALNELPTFNMFPLVALLVGAAAQQTLRKSTIRVLMAGLFSGGFALIVTRIVQDVAPSRPRPAYDPVFQGVFPFANVPPDWSSFPSDTAALAVALAVTVVLANRRIGYAALLWAGLISFARIAIGLHYLTDVTAGIVIGAVSAMIGASLGRRWTQGVRLVDRAWTAYPGPVAIAALFVFLQVSTMGEDVRRPLTLLLKGIGVVREQPKDAVRMARYSIEHTVSEVSNRH